MSVTPKFVLCATVICALAAPVAAADPTDFFEAKVRPVLVKHCQKCHGAEAQKGGLRLDSRPGWQAGGENGPVIVPGKPEASSLVKAVGYADKNLKMPPAGKLADHEVAALTEWVKQGAVDPRDGGPAKIGGLTPEQAKAWWSLQRVNRPAVPRNEAANPVDAFLLEKLAAQKLTFSPPADKRTLIRRATYDLTGLPPTPDEVEAFVRDESPEAFARLVDRLLASPAYGERWGRHWLDLVRYADTAGENSDHPLPHAWRYRNWVIDAFNRDQPYDQFLREQIAGDILAAQGPPAEYARRVVATGFLAIARRFGHDIDKDMHLTREDLIDTLGKSVLGLTLGCARCHEHKYDPVSQKDFYALAGIFESTKFAYPGCEPNQRPRDLVPMIPPAEWARTVEPYLKQLAAVDAEIKKVADEQAVVARRLKEAWAKAGRKLASGEVPDGGSQELRHGGKPLDPIDVQAGQVIRLSVSPLKNHGADSTLTEWQVAEVGGKGRTWDLKADVLDDFLAGNPHADRHGNPAVWCFLDGRDGTPLPETLRDFQGKAGLNIWRNGDTPSAFVTAGKDPVSVWTKLPPRSVFVHPAPNGPVTVAWVSPISGKVRVTGRVADAHPGGPDGVGWAIDHIPADLGADFGKLAALVRQRTELTAKRSTLIAGAPQVDLAYAVVEGTPKDSPLHQRGDPEKPGPVVPRRWLEVLGGHPVPAGGGSGRLALAGWLTDSRNPLTARVMVNRIWQHHFGNGLVKTPNDFGTRGQPPTHPELLDWLASEFVASGWSVKAMHRRIMLSAAYQQAGATRPDAAERDPGNDLYWRFEPRRLSAEELRDSLLVLGGNLDRSPGGPHPFPPEDKWNFTQHTPFNAIYETDRRSVYLMTLRNRRHPYLGLFDGADPNATTPQRQVTTVPTQALYFLNDPFFHRQAERLAGRALAMPSDEARLDELFRLALQRPPTTRDRQTADRFVRRYEAAVTDLPAADRSKAAWAALARVVLAGNEFLYLD